MTTTKPTLLRNGPWGYNMTNNSFYEVLSETAKTAIVKRINSKSRSTGFLCGYESPVAGSELSRSDEGKTYRIMKKVMPDGSIKYRGKADSYCVNTLEVVTEEQEFYFNHCD